MAQEVATIDSKRKALSADIRKMEGQFAMALPAHIKPEKFTRVAVTAIMTDPYLVEAERSSLIGACVQCAQDGLLPDKKEAALVVFNTKNKEGRWEKRVQYMPMVAGILKKARNSGEIGAINAHVVYSRDTFEYELGDNEYIKHKPCLAADRGQPILAYAIVHLKDGSIMRAVMTVAEIDKVRQASRAKDSGPWVDWWDQMAIKSVIRRLAKYLPSSTDKENLSEVIERDDSLYEFNSAESEAAIEESNVAILNKQVSEASLNAQVCIEPKANAKPKPSSAKGKNDVTAGEPVVVDDGINQPVAQGDVQDAPQADNYF